MRRASPLRALRMTGRYAVISTPSGDPQRRGAASGRRAQQRLGDEMGVHDVCVVADLSLELLHVHVPCLASTTPVDIDSRMHRPHRKGMGQMRTGLLYVSVHDGWDASGLASNSDPCPGRANPRGTTAANREKTTIR